MKIAVHFGACPCPASTLIEVRSPGEAMSRLVRFVLDAPEVSERRFWAWHSVTIGVPDSWPCREVLGQASYAAYVTPTVGFVVVRLYEVQAGRLGACVQEVALPKALSSSFSARSSVRALPRVQFDDVWYYRDDRLREFRRCDNPHERITFDELLHPG